MFWSSETMFLTSSIFIISSTFSSGKLTYCETSSTVGILVLFSDNTSIASLTFDILAIVSRGVFTIFALSLR
jgi:hypothetical protein